MYNPLIHNRQSRPLQRFDYASEGLYFLTINTENRQPLFGIITNGEMQLNDAGKIAVECWLAIPSHFPHAALHDFVIMPDHIHGVIEIIYNPVGASAAADSPRLDQKTIFKSPSKTIGSIVRGFKIGVTKWMRQNTTVHKVWQRDYHDHIIRNSDAFERICNYIQANPKNWKNP